MKETEIEGPEVNIFIRVNRKFVQFNCKANQTVESAKAKFHNEQLKHILMNDKKPIWKKYGMKLNEEKTLVESNVGNGDTLILDWDDIDTASKIKNVLNLRKMEN